MKSLNEKKERNLIISCSLNETLQSFLKYYPELSRFLKEGYKHFKSSNDYDLNC